MEGLNSSDLWTEPGAAVAAINPPRKLRVLREKDPESGIAVAGEATYLAEEARK